MRVLTFELLMLEYYLNLYCIVILINTQFRGVKEKRDAYIKRLNGIYVRNLENSNVEIIEGYGSFVGNLQGSQWSWSDRSCGSKQVTGSKIGTMVMTGKFPH